MLFFYANIAAFILLLLVLLRFKANFFYFSPVLPIAGLLILSVFFALDKLVLFIVLLTPFSITLKDFENTLSLALPTEPLMFGVFVFFLYKIFSERILTKDILRQPVSISVLFYLIWILFTSITSQDIIVSLKFLLTKLWFITPFYFLGILIFKNPKNIKLFSWLYLIPLAIVILIVTYKHSLFFFDRQEGNLISQPFYRDHTIYGAAIALLVPIAVALIFKRKQTHFFRYLAIIISIVLLLGLFLSYSRAAWMSVLVSLGIFVVIKLKINYKIVISFAAIVIGVFVYMQTQIMIQLSTNKQDSSEQLMEHVQSISNISSDASNLERINRWSCAIRMFEAKPLFGWGPGTYQLFYGPFQRSYEKTIISTDFGDMGNAHSEYLGPLSESGVLGLLSILFLFGAIIYSALMTLKKITPESEMYIYLMGAFLGLINYFVHGVLNNFLDTDKLAVPFWGFAAIIVAINLYHTNSQASEKNLKLSSE